MPNEGSDPKGLIEYVDYRDESILPEIMALVDRDLSEPYSVFTYRYFLVNWPQLCICAIRRGELVGVVVCKAEEEPDRHNRSEYRGYIAMLAVSDSCRRRGIGSVLVKQAVQRMRELKCVEAMLETEVTNAESLRLYGRLGFARDEVGALCRLALKHFLDFKQPQQHENARAMNFVL
eukprot:CAMPEP_0172611732 /NCGR_PEP_ID=MMETSP1068-20121228/31384_1 /TAXON_ID=35684 /ORGANISM="Pseudopedinella elastica, Strain CCMP716" /LENGTH=176 /DNA_ID=CAMNT_0013415789 /DNA_START=197 /DNA_END=727 /DNA_ORIENTATION=-